MAAPKLNRVGRRFLIEQVIAGLSNNEIRIKLEDAGHAHDITDQTFTHYRNCDEVKAAIAGRDAEAIQSGHALRAVRIKSLVRSAKRFEQLLAEGVDDQSFRPMKKRELAVIHKEYRETLAEIGALVDPKKPVPLELTGKNGEPVKFDVQPLTDEQRLARLASLLDKARARRDRPAHSGSGAADVPGLPEGDDPGEVDG